jgi:hypothetical protein
MQKKSKFELNKYSFIYMDTSAIKVFKPLAILEILKN